MIETSAQRKSRLQSIHFGENSLSLRLVGQDIELTETTSYEELVAAEVVHPDYQLLGYPFTYTSGPMTAAGVWYNWSHPIGFTVSDATTPATVYGAWIYNNAVPLQRVRLDRPVPMDAVGKRIALMIYDGYPPGLVGLKVVFP
jgi:hypothetical protein